MNEMADAPGLRAYWRKKEKERLVGIMPRATLNLSSLRDDGTPAPFDLTTTPLADLVRDSVVLGAAAWRTGDATFRIAAFRDDPKDGPDEHVNQYQFNVITSLEGYPKFWQMLVPASTCCNENMRQFDREFVFFEKRRTGDGFVHRLSEVPAPFDIIFGGHE